jgi:hypothetical protein
MGGGGTAVEPDEPVRPGRGKALPLIVGGVVAVAVFGILMGVRGRPRAAPVDPPKTPTKTEAPAVPVGDDKPAKPDKPENKPAVVTPPPKQDIVPDAAPVAKAVVPDAAPVAKAVVPDAAPVVKMTTLTFSVAPPEASDNARISVNGKPIEGTTLDIEKTAQIKVDVKASGYQTYSKRIDVPPDGQINIDLKKTVAPSRPKRTKPIL